MSSLVSRDVVDALYAAGHHLLVNDRILEAAEAFRALVVRAESDERGWLGLAACHHARGELQLALGLLSVGSVAAGHTTRMLVARAELLRALGDDQAADRLLEVAREHASDDDLLQTLITRTEREAS